MADLFPDSGDDSAPRRAGTVATYDYVDADGKLRFQVVRKSDKTFPQRRPDGNGGWVWNLKGVQRVPYRLPRLVETAGAGGMVIVVEGEKDVHALEQLGLVATTNPGGAGKWLSEYVLHFEGVSAVVVIPDDDAPGREHAEAVAKALRPVAPVKIVEVWPTGDSGADVSDWLALASNDDQREQARKLLLDIIDRHAKFDGASQVRPIGDAPSESGAEAAGESAGASPRPGVYRDAGRDAPTSASTRDVSLEVEEAGAFAAVVEASAEPLLGDAENTVLAAGGVAAYYGDGGAGKTTLGLDRAFHYCAGGDWLGLQVARPLRVLWIENEGPRGKLPREGSPEVGVLGRARHRWSAARSVESVGTVHVRGRSDASRTRRARPRSRDRSRDRRTGGASRRGGRWNAGADPGVR